MPDATRARGIKFAGRARGALARAVLPPRQRVPPYIRALMVLQALRLARTRRTMALLRLLALCASGCALAGACETLPHGAASLQQTPTDGAFTYGTSLFSLTFDAETYALRNLTTCSADKQHAQGLLSDDTWGGSSGAASSQPLGSLWQLNYTACTTTMPFGITLDALASNATKRQVRSEGNNGEWYSLRLDLTLSLSLSVSLCLTALGPHGMLRVLGAAPRGALAGERSHHGAHTAVVRCGRRRVRAALWRGRQRDCPNGRRLLASAARGVGGQARPEQCVHPRSGAAQPPPCAA